MANNNSEILSSGETAQYLGVSKPSVVTLVREGKLKGQRVSNANVILKRDAYQL